MVFFCYETRDTHLALFISGMTKHCACEAFVPPMSVTAQRARICKKSTGELIMFLFADYYIVQEFILNWIWICCRRDASRCEHENEDWQQTRTQISTKHLWKHDNRNTVTGCDKHTKRKHIRNIALVKRKNSKNKGQVASGWAVDVPPRKPLCSLRTS